MAAKVYVTEFQGSGVDTSRARLQVADASTTSTENASSPITASGSHQEFTAFGATTTFIRVKTDSGGPINFKIGTSPVVTTANAHLSSDQCEYFAVKAGDNISVIVSAA